MNLLVWRAGCRARSGKQRAARSVRTAAGAVENAGQRQGPAVYDGSCRSVRACLSSTQPNTDLGLQGFMTTYKSLMKNLEQRENNGLVISGCTGNSQGPKPVQPGAHAQGSATTVPGVFPTSPTQTSLCWSRGIPLLSSLRRSTSGQPFSFSGSVLSFPDHRCDLELVPL